MATTYQIFVRLLDGRFRCLRFPSPTISGEYLLPLVASIIGVPLAGLRLVTGCSNIYPSTFLAADESTGLFPTVQALSRLRGGKGGFGSLLRGAASKAGQKKTSNFDACRDMSGRRLRHVNAERRLEEWRAEAEDRRLEKLAEDFLRKKAKENQRAGGGGGPDVEKYLAKFRADADRCAGEVEESVRESFGRYKESKRKALPASGSSSKRLKIWSGKKKLEESDSDEEDGVDDGAVDVVKPVNPGTGDASGSQSGSGDASPSQSEGENSCEGSQHSDLDNPSGNSMGTSEEVGVIEPGSADVGGGEDHSKEPVAQTSITSDSQDLAPTPDELPKCNMSVLKEGTACIELRQKEATISDTVDVHQAKNKDNEPLNLQMFSSASELEVLGMDRLKAALQANGLKCGGTLQERASRLFLLKTTPIQKLPKKVLARGC